MYVPSTVLFIVRRRLLPGRGGGGGETLLCLQDFSDGRKGARETGSCTVEQHSSSWCWNSRQGKNTMSMCSTTVKVWNFVASRGHASLQCIAYPLPPRHVLIKFGIRFVSFRLGRALIVCRCVVRGCGWYLSPSPLGQSGTVARSSRL